MTEDEAKTKWCPHVRIADTGADNAVACNRYTSEDYGSNCIASDCMMWRWGNDGAKSLGQQQAEGVGIIEQNGGYCGLTK